MVCVRGHVGSSAVLQCLLPSALFVPPTRPTDGYERVAHPWCRIRLSLGGWALKPQLPGDPFPAIALADGIAEKMGAATWCCLPTRPEAWRDLVDYVENHRR